jgi:hypothetical protein
MATNPNTTAELKIISRIISDIKKWGKLIKIMHSKGHGMYSSYAYRRTDEFESEVLGHFDFLQNYELRDSSSPNAKKIELEELKVAKEHLMKVHKALLVASPKTFDIKEIFVHLSKAIVELQKLKGLEIRLG